jgi:hypothetical protein
MQSEPPQPDGCAIMSDVGADIADAPIQNEAGHIVLDGRRPSEVINSINQFLLKPFEWLMM